MGRTVRIDDLANVVMEGLQEYADLATDSMKAAVKKAGNTVKTDITANAPERTGRYAKSWRAKTTKESATAFGICWRTCWNMATPNAAAVVWRLSRTSLPRSSAARRNWNGKSKGA